MSKPSICLNMIVKDESHIIQECFDAVAPYIDYWVIVDTGSTDGTQDLIKSYMDKLKIPGELHERPWVNFGHNRTEAIELAKDHCDYIFIMDADDTIEGKIDLTDLSHDAYELNMRDDNAFAYYTRRLIVKSDLPWKFIGMVHEYIIHDNLTDSKIGFLKGDYYVVSRRLGNRNKNFDDKNKKDIEFLLKEIDEDPNNSRPVFYLASTYLSAHKYKDALETYEKRISMGGWEEEVYVCYLRSIVCMNHLKYDWPEILTKCLEAWDFRPIRSETLLFVADYYKKNNNHHLAYFFANKAAQIPLPKKDVLFVETAFYTWRAFDELSVCATNIGKFDQAKQLCDHILSQNFVPDEERPRIEDNKRALEEQINNEFRASLAEPVL